LQRNFRNSAILRSLSSAREIFARGMIGTEVFHRKFSQLSHFSTPFVGTRKKFRGSRDRDFSQKCFRNSYILRPICRHEKKFSRREDTNGNFFTEIFRNSAILAPLLSARENFLRIIFRQQLNPFILIGGANMTESLEGFKLLGGRNHTLAPLINYWGGDRPPAPPGSPAMLIIRW